jgi:hypothetical protein
MTTQLSLPACHARSGSAHLNCNPGGSLAWSLGACFNYLGAGDFTIILVFREGHLKSDLA